MSAQCPSTPHQYEDMHNTPYCEAIGSPMYAVLSTCLDIAFAVTYLSQFMQKPTRTHWDAVKRVFRYLNGTQEHVLTISDHRNNQNGLRSFCNADWASQAHWDSMSGYIFTINGGMVSWSSKKQAIVALSMTEAEYVSATHAVKEVLWLHTFLAKIARPLNHPTILFCDNQSAIAIMKDDQYHACTKHINVQHHFICDIISRSDISVVYCPTADNTANIFTKPLASPKVEKFASLMGLHPA